MVIVPLDLRVVPGLAVLLGLAPFAPWYVLCLCVVPDSRAVGLSSATASGSAMVAAVFETVKKYFEKV